MPCGQFHEQIGLNEKDQGTCSLHVFTNLEFSYCFFEKKLSFLVRNNILYWHFIIYFDCEMKLYLGQIKTNGKFRGKKFIFRRFRFGEIM